MSYTPPRGSCSQKTSMIASCSCHRFMIHPLKAATSFDCDGCGHHASFHRMENPLEEETVRRWRAEEGARTAAVNGDGTPFRMLKGIDDLVPPKRRRIAAKPEVERIVDLLDEEADEMGGDDTANGKVSGVGRKRKGKGL